MSGYDDAGRGSGGGVGADVPRVPVGAGAWGAGSERALDFPGPEEFGLLDGELLREPGAWKAGEPDPEPSDTETAGAAYAGTESSGTAYAGVEKVTAPYARGLPRQAREPGLRADGRAVTPRRPGADPVKVLMHRHRDLCERAVDPLEIAAGLEAHGVTDRTASRFRHKDVFSLAEEMFARVPRDGEPDEAPVTAPAARTTGVRGAWAGLA
ncbi:hypothetical protein G3I40_02970, partial [Streptomyces sp. SID14478]|nr:hypothetical protein [Streptomyces sp. SID14478]